jgi:hypothetical protein
VTSWRDAHHHYLTAGHDESMPVVLERFELLYSA